MVNEKKQALALYLQTKEDNIEVSEWNENTFIINPHKELVGRSPEYYKETIEELKKLLSPADITAIDKFMIFFAKPDYSEEELQELIDTYENGNKQAFRQELKKLNAYETATLISLWQPYHSAIAKIQIAYDIQD